jgi:NAD-dependent SIR2 family protein deacetylase
MYMTRSSKSKSKYHLEMAMETLKQATAILVVAGNQLSIDSGIPDYTDVKTWNERFAHLLEFDCYYDDVWDSDAFISYPHVYPIYFIIIS